MQPETQTNGHAVPPNGPAMFNGNILGVEADESPQLGQLAAALAKAQGDIRNAAKDRENPHFKSSYATLASVWDACREPLSKNGLAVIQRVNVTGEGVLLTTMLVHSSNEFIRDRLLMPIAQRTAQGVGSAITYARRYALAAIVGVAPEDEDDDGNTASGRDYRAPEPRQSATSRAKEELKAKVAEKTAPEKSPWQRIVEFAAPTGLDEKALAEKVKTITGKQSSKELDGEDVKKVEHALTISDLGKSNGKKMKTVEAKDGESTEEALKRA